MSNEWVHLIKLFISYFTKISVGHLVKWLFIKSHRCFWHMSLSIWRLNIVIVDWFKNRIRQLGRPGRSLSVRMWEPMSLLGRLLVRPLGRVAPTALWVTPHLLSVRVPNKLMGSPAWIVAESCLGVCWALDLVCVSPRRNSATWRHSPKWTGVCTTCPVLVWC